MNEPTIEEAVLQDAWLRRVARALVRDVHAAEDLTQDAWVDGLRRRRTRTADRPWLGGMLRHKAFSDRRKAASRRDRERQTARREATAAPDDVAAQLELRELVSRELGALDEPYRTAVYLHFVEGKSMRKVAQQLDVAVSTAHSRVNGGVDRLRKQLDVAYDGDRRVWLGLMAPWGRAAVPVTAWSAGLGMIAMGALVAVSAGAAVLAFKRPEPTLPAVETMAAGLATPAGEALSAVTPNSLRTEAAAALAPSTPPSSAATAATPTRTLAQDSPSGAIIQGRWTRPDGPFAAGAAWKLESSNSNRQLVRTFGVPDNWEDLEGTLGTDGRLELHFEPHPSQQYYFTMDHPDFVPMKWRWGKLGEGDVKNLGDIALQAAGQIQGTLVNPNGEPLGFKPWRIHAKAASGESGLGLQVAAAFAETDDEAGFAFDRLPEGLVQLQLQERNLGWIQGPLVEVVAGELSVVEFPFTPPDGTQDRVVLTCHVLLRSLIDPLRPEQLTLVHPEGARVVATRDPAYPEAYVFEDVGDGDHRLELDDPRLTLMGASRVRRGTSVQCLVQGNALAQLNVTGPDGATIEKYSTDLSLLAPGAEPRTYTFQQARDGKLQGLLPGDYELTVRAGALTGSATIADLMAGETRPVAVTLAQPVALSGQVLRPDGTPAARVMVRLITPAPVGDRPGLRILDGRLRVHDPSQYRGQASVTHTDEEGRYSLPLVQAPALIALAGDFPGPMVEAAPFAYLPESAPGSTLEPIELVLPEPARFIGKILIPEDTNVSGWRVTLQRPGLSESHFPESAAVTPGGHFTLGPTAPGEAQLILSMSGGGGATSLSSPGGSPPERPFLGTAVLQGGETGTGEFEYPGAPLIQASFSFTGAGAEGDDHSAFVARVPSGPVDIAAAKGPVVGPFRLEPGPHKLWLAGDGWAALLSTVAVPTTDGATIPVHVSLTHARVQVMVDGAPLPSHRLSFIGAPSGLTLPQFKTDAEGFLDLRLGAGDYTFHPSQASQDPELSFKIGDFEWPLPNGDTVIELKSMGWETAELFSK